MEYKFRIDYVDSTNEVGDLRDVITLIGWTYCKVNGDDIINYIEAETVVGEPDTNNFIPLDDVTIDQMISWVRTSVDEQHLQSRLNQ